MPGISWLIVVLGSLGNIIIGLVTYLRTPKSATSRWFAIFAFLFALYLIVNQLSLTQTEDSSTLLWIRVVMVVAPAIVFSFFMLVNVFPKPKLELSRKIFVGSLLATIAIMILDSTPLIFADVVPSTNQPIPGDLVFLFPLFNVIFLGWSVYILIKKYRESSGLEKKQLKYFLFGAIAMFSLILFSNVFLVVLFGISSLVVLVPIYTLVFVGFVSYAIVQFGLFDIRVIATEALTVILWVVLFSKIFVAETGAERAVDSLVFVVVVVFGVLLIRSVRREVQQREKLEELTEKLKELHRRKDEFISVAAHELRAPMTAIKGYLSFIIEGDAGEINNKIREYVEEAVSGNDRLIRLVNNMLNVSRIEEGRLTFDMGEVNLTEVVRTVFKEFEVGAKEKALQYLLEIPAQISDRVYVDRDRIHEVVANFVSNAIKYTDHGEVRVKIFNPSPTNIRVEVVDTGPGLSAEEQQKLFQKFYRAESHAGKVLGTGLGLYISKLLMEKFGGTIGVVSEKAHGSTFWFELPIRK